MPRAGAELLLEVMRYTRALAQDGVTLFGVGELGMANTTPAAAIVSVLTGSDAQEVVGIGANLPLAKVATRWRWCGGLSPSISPTRMMVSTCWRKWVVLICWG
jgi:hypothetical protein